MRIHVLCLAAVLGIASVAIAEDAKELLKDYKGDVALPPDLYATYARLVAAFEAGERDAIEGFCLPGKIAFSAEPRPSGKEDYGQEINLPFLRKFFHKFILNLRRDSDTEYLIRTGSTALWFSKTEAGWKLSRYLDKPIE